MQSRKRQPEGASRADDGQAVQAALSRARAALKPPPRLTITEWAARNLRLPGEFAAEPGPWSPTRYPYQRGILDAASDGRAWRIVLMSSSQVGKSTCLDCIAGYFIDQDPSPILWVFPTLELAEGYSKGRLAPLIDASPALKRAIGEPRSRDSLNSLRYKAFPGGYVVLAGANSAASLQSRPIRVVLLDEVDQYPADVDGQGDPVSLAVQRTARYWNRLVVMAGTPTVRGASRLERAFLESDQRKFFVPCPRCGAFFVIEWRHVIWEHAEPASARIRCPSCSADVGDRERLTAVQRGEWRPTVPSSGGTIGFHVWEAYAAPRLATIVAEFLEQKKHRETLQAFTNLRLGELWEDATEKSFDWQSLQARSETYDPLTIPAPAVGLLTCGVDVQDDRLAVLVLGWARGEECWVVYWEEIYGDTSGEEPWSELGALLSRQFEHPSGARLEIQSCAIDAGHRTQRVYEFCRTRGRTMAVKGSNQPTRPVLGRPTPQDVTWSGQVIKRGVLLWPIGTDTAKSEIMSRLKITEPGPRFVHFYGGLPAEFYEQLTSEVLATRYHKGVARLEWVLPAGKRNEALDAFVYAYAAALRVGLGRFDWDRLTEAITEAGKGRAPGQSAVPQWRPPQSDWMRRGLE